MPIKAAIYRSGAVPALLRLLNKAVAGEEAEAAEAALQLPGGGEEAERAG
eukprot:SAG22_NODE_8119_length_681_cov_1.441581_1_plen_49_part_10